VRKWRERILYRTTLVAVALLGTFSGGVFAYQHWQLGLLWPVGTVAVVVATLWVTARASVVGANVRTGLIIALAYGSGLLALCTLGLNAEGLMGMFAFIAMAAVLLGAKRGRQALYVASATVALCGAGHLAGWLAAPDPSVVDATNPWNWLRVAGYAGAVISVVGGGAGLLMSELMKALHDRTALINQLREENKERELASTRLAETQERLLHAHKLEAVGRLAGGIAHDFNNTLTVILSYGELIKARLGPKHPIGDLADQIIQAAEQGGDLTKQLLTFTRRQMVKPRTIDVQQVLRNTERALFRLVPRTIRVHRVESPDELFIKIDPTQLQQAILNMALNARDAMPDGGDLYLEVGAATLEKENNVPVLPGNYVMLRVRDTGTGMSDETRSIT